MTQKVFELKEELINYISEQVKTRSVGQMNTGEMGQVVDMIKDLAEAEHHCWEACYYKAITEAMHTGSRMGYNGSGVGSNAMPGYSHYMSDNRGYSDSMRGYSDPLVTEIKDMINKADPASKERLMSEISNMARSL